MEWWKNEARLLERRARTSMVSSSSVSFGSGFLEALGRQGSAIAVITVQWKGTYIYTWIRVSLTAPVSGLLLC